MAQNVALIVLPVIRSKSDEFGNGTPRILGVDVSNVAELEYDTYDYSVVAEKKVGNTYEPASYKRNYCKSVKKPDRSDTIQPLEDTNVVSATLS